MKLIYPDYNNCLVNLSNSLLKYYGVKPYHDSLSKLDEYLNRDYKNIVLILYDGFGSNLIKNKLGKDSFLYKNKVKDIASVFPATTTAATTSIITGLTPMEHGWLGWDIYLKSINKTVTMYWNVIKETETKLADFNICKKEFPYISIFDHINATKNAKAYQVSPYGGINYNVDKIDDMYSKITELCQTSEKKFIYAYCNEPDFTMHEFGTNSDKAIRKMEFLNNKTEQFCENLEDALIIITADHGHINVGNYIALTDYPNLTAMLVRETSLEARVTNFFVKEGMLKNFKEEFNKLFKDDFLLLPKHEVIDRQLFGNGMPNDKFESCLGDYLALAISDKAIVDKYEENPLKGLHAGITEDEVLVPLIVIDKK